MRLNQVTLPAADVARSVAFYRTLGFEQIVDAPHYARFKAPVGDATFSVERMEGQVGAARAIVYFECDDLDQQVAALKTVWDNNRVQQLRGSEAYLPFVRR